jgi:hypothetical protein
VTFDPSGGTGGHRGPPLPGDVAPPWWEDDRGWGDDDGWGEFPRRRRSRILQWTGVVVAAALVLGSAGSLAGVLLDDHSSVVLPTSDVTLATSAGGRRLVITFEIENPTGADVAPICTVAVVYGGRDVVGPGEAQLGSLPAHARMHRGVTAAVTSSPPPGSRARVACRT